MPRVTLIASIYNVADCVGRFIQSLNRQTFRDFVVFFVNDGTKDDSFDRIVRDLAEGTALRYIHVDAAGKAFSSDRPERLDEAANYGLNATRKTALAFVETEYVCFVDPDDWIDDDYLARLVSAADGAHADMAKAELCRDYDGGKCERVTRNPEIEKDLRRGWPASRRFCGSQWITALYRTDFVRGHGIAYRTRADGFEYDADDIFLLECLLHGPKIAFVDGVRYHYYQRPTSAVHTLDRRRFESTAKSRVISMECLNRALDEGRLTPQHYGIIVRRILWELDKHYRIYVKSDAFDREWYLRECARIVGMVQWVGDLTPASLGFLDALLHGDFARAHQRMSNPAFVLLDKARLLPYGVS